MSTMTAPTSTPTAATSAPTGTVAGFNPNAYETREIADTFADFNITSGYYYDPAFDLSLISSRSLKTQVRRVLLDPDHVAKMVEDLNHDPNKSWPAILIRKDGNTYTVLNGNHRVAAAGQVNRATWPAVVVDLSGTPDPTLVAQQIMYAANKRSGLALSREENLQNGHNLVKQGIPMDSAAKIVGVSKSTLHLYARTVDVQERMGLLGIRADVINAVTAQVAREAMKITNNKPFKHTIELIAAFGHPFTTVKPLIDAVAKAGGETEQFALIEAYREKWTQDRDRARNTSKAMTRLSVSEKSNRELARIETMFNADTVVTLYPDAESRATADEKITATIEALKKSQRVLRAAIRKDEKN